MSGSYPLPVWIGVSLFGCLVALHRASGAPVEGSAVPPDRAVAFRAALAAAPPLPEGIVRAATYVHLEDLPFARLTVLGSEGAQRFGLSEIFEAVVRLKQWFPEERYAVVNDSAFRSAVLRTPGLRGRAAGFFGLTLGDETSGAPANVLPAVPRLPSFPGHKGGFDNCPLCKARAAAADAANQP
jgi:hypothetical protein